MTDFWLAVVQGIASGIVASILASAIWLSILRRLRPRVSISEQVAWDGTNSWIKLVNKSSRAIVDLQVTIDVMSPRSAKGGVWFQRHAVATSGTMPLIVAGAARKSDDDNAYRFMLNLDPNDVVRQGNSSVLRFRLYARDEVSGVGRLVEQKYALRTDVISGEFVKGQGFEIT